MWKQNKRKPKTNLLDENLDSLDSSYTYIGSGKTLSEVIMIVVWTLLHDFVEKAWDIISIYRSFIDQNCNFKWTNSIHKPTII